MIQFGLEIVTTIALLGQVYLIAGTSAGCRPAPSRKEYILVYKHA